MSDKPLLRVMCSKAKNGHIVGTVHSDCAGGYELRYKGAVRVAGTGNERDDFEAWDSVFRPDAGTSSPGFDAYCAACRRRYFVPVDQIFHSASRGLRTFQLQGRNAEARYQRKALRAD